MNAAPLHLRIERLSLLLLAAGMVGSAVFTDLTICLGLLIGGLFGVGNFYALRRLVFAIARSENHHKQTMMVLILVLKFGLVAFCIYGALKFLPVNAIALLMGISVVVLAIFIEGFRFICTDSVPQSE
jgi:hypothetical protein